MLKLNKIKVISTVMTIIMIITIGSTVINAENIKNLKTNETLINEFELKTVNRLNIITDTVDIDLSENNLATVSAVTESGFVTGFNSAKQYRTYDFVQFDGGRGKNCAPTLVANVLSYFQTARGVSLNASNITQSLYNQICTDMGFITGTGKELKDISNSIKIWANRYGKTCVTNTYLFNLWSDVTRDIDANKPVMLGYKEHSYLILGYKVENGVKKLFVSTGFLNNEYQYLDFTSEMKMCSVNIY